MDRYPERRGYSRKYAAPEVLDAREDAAYQREDSGFNTPSTTFSTGSSINLTAEDALKADVYRLIIKWKLFNVRLFSVGLILYEMFDKWQKRSVKDTDYFLNIRRGVFHEQFGKDLWQYADNDEGPVKNLILSMVDKNPKIRPTVKALLGDGKIPDPDGTRVLEVSRLNHNND